MIKVILDSLQVPNSPLLQDLVLEGEVDLTMFACFVETEFGFRLTEEDFALEKQERMKQWMLQFAESQKVIEFSRKNAQVSRELFPIEEVSLSKKFIVLNLDIGIYRTPEQIENLPSDRQPEFRLRSV